MKKRTKWVLIAAVGVIALFFPGVIGIQEVLMPVGGEISQTEDLTVIISPPSSEPKGRILIFDYDSLNNLHFRFWAQTPNADYARLEVDDVVITARGHTNLVINELLTDHPENMVFKEDTWAVIQEHGQKQFSASYFYWPKEPSEPYRLLGNQARINVKAKISVRSKSNDLLTTRNVESHFILKREYGYVPWWIFLLIPKGC